MTQRNELLREALAFHHAGRLREAEAIYSRVLADEPDNAEALHLSGLVAFREARYDDAIALLRRAVGRAPDNALYVGNLGNVLKESGRRDEAIAAYRRALELDAGHIAARHSLGTLLSDAGRLDDAARELQDVASRKPDDFSAHFELGNIAARSGHMGAAERAYRRALALNPDFGDALAKLGALLRTTGRVDEAVPLLRRRAIVETGSARAQAQLADALQDNGQFEQAVTSYQNALALAPDAVDIRALFCALLQRTCDWERLALHVRDLLQAITRGKPGVPLRLLIALHEATPATQLEAARANAAATSVDAPLATRRRVAQARRLRVGYLCGSVDDERTASTLAPLFEAHDRSQCELLLFAYGREGGGKLGARVRAAADVVFDVALESDEAAAKRIAAANVDVLVDVDYGREGARDGIAAHRSAPVQLRWLGVPATSGAPWYDALIADEHVVPHGAERDFAERIVRLPNGYHVHDRNRPRPTVAPERAACGLPQGAIVLACFQPPATITAPMFALWLRVLAAVPDAVLWLTDDNVLATASLQRRAAQQRVAPERLVFAPSRTRVEELARYRIVDIALDTFPCASNGVAIDALSMSCPMITLAGDTFASRVAASLLANVGMQPLIATSPSEYEALAIEIARDRKRQTALRAQLDRTVLASPLFAADTFARDLERAYRDIASASENG